MESNGFPMCIHVSSATQKLLHDVGETTLPPELVQALCMAFGLVPRTRAVGGSESAVVARVAAGVGVTLVPQTLINPRQEGVRFVPLEDGVTLDVGLVTRADPGNPAVGALLLAAQNLNAPT